MNLNISHQEFWLIIGIGGLIVEVLSGGFWIIFMGFGALLTALLVWIGVLNSLDGEIVFFVVCSVVLLFLLRKPILARFNKGASGKHMGDPSGQVLQVTKEIPVGGQGQVEFQGSTWEALSEEKVAILAGSKVKIVRQEGLKLWVNTFEKK